MTERTVARLAEVTEAEATGRVAALYDEIRRVTGVRTVALVYRVLASRPTTLEAIWGDVGPNLADPVVREGALALDGVLGRPAAPLAPELVTVSRERAATTLASFARINRLNLVGLTALLDGVTAPVAKRVVARSRPDAIGDGLPMADLAALPPTTIALLEEMGASVAGAERPLVIPSLFRYFADDERLLRALWTGLRPVVDDPAFAARTASLRHDAATLAAGLPYRVHPLPRGEARTVVERFLRTIPAMILIGGALGGALGLADRLIGQLDRPSTV